VLVDINGLTGLDRLEATDRTLVVGALSRQRTLELSPEAAAIGALADGLPLVGHVATRNRGTVGGSLAHADPASDLPAAVLALGGTVVLRSPRGERHVPITGFYTGVFSSVKEPDELIVEIRVPRTGGAGWAYEKFTRRAIDWAIVGSRWSTAGWGW
jgi:carbon-monoxide dehydrogenase medium subunit